MYKVCGTDGAQIHYVVYHVKSYLIELVKFNFSFNSFIPFFVLGYQSLCI
jgi:hypothetical protein